MFCVTCGEVVDPTSRFCRRCGEPLSGDRENRESVRHDREEGSVLYGTGLPVLRIGQWSVPIFVIGVLVGGILLFVASFLDWFIYHSDYGVVAENAWGVGFFAYTGMELGLVAVGLTVFLAFSPVSSRAARIILTGAATAGALGTALILLKLAVGMTVLSPDVTFDPAVGLWLGLAASVLIVAFLGLALAVGARAQRRKTGERQARSSVDPYGTNTHEPPDGRGAASELDQGVRREPPGW